jgi:hypothetical protein
VGGFQGGPAEWRLGVNIITTQGKKPLVSFAYKTEAEAKQAAAKVWPVIANAISVTPHVIVR